MTAPCSVQARGNVEAWLSQVEQSMAVCLRKLARAGHQTYPNQPRTQWVTQQPSQLVLLISQVPSCRLLLLRYHDFPAHKICTCLGQQRFLQHVFAQTSMHLLGCLVEQYVHLQQCDACL